MWFVRYVFIGFCILDRKWIIDQCVRTGGVRWFIWLLWFVVFVSLKECPTNFGRTGQKVAS